MRPYEMIVLYSAIPLFIAADSLASRGWEWRKVLHRALPLAIVAPVFAYTVCLFELHPVFKYWASQGVDSVQPIAMILAHTGLAGALLAARLCLVKRFPLSTPIDRFVLCWMLTVLFLVVGNSLPLPKLLPYSPQLITGLMPPMILLAVPLLDRARWPSIARHAIVWRGALCAVIALDALDDVYLLRSLTPKGQSWELEAYTPTPEMKGYAWIDGHTPENDVVLCLGRTGLRLPKYASVRVIAGHWSVTPHSQEMDEMVRSFFKGSMSAEVASELLRVCRVTRVYFGAREQQWGPPREELMPGFERHDLDGGVIVYSLTDRGDSR
jgi:hypothetical protein